MDLSPAIAACLAITLAAIILFAWDVVPADVVALGVMMAVIVFGLVPVEEAISGFGSTTVLMILGLLVMTTALMNTGVVDIVGRYIVTRAGKNPNVLLGVIMVSVTGLSAFVSNTAATAFFIPVVLGVSAQNKTSPSRYLLPLAFASILSSSVTLISTSTNIVISELIKRAGEPPMGIFELAPVGIPITIAGLIYMFTIGVRLMPVRETDEEAAKAEVGNRVYQADLTIPEESPFIGKPLKGSLIAENLGFTPVKFLRNGKMRDLADPELTLEAGDEIVVEGERRHLLKIKDLAGVEIKADLHLADPELPAEELEIVEGVLMPDSPLIGRTLRGAEFHERYGLQVLGLNRAGYTAPQKLSRIRLRLGDVLLLQGSAENVKALERGNLFSIFGGVNRERLKTSHAPLAAAIFMITLLAASFGLISVPVAAIGGAFLMLATRCISPEDSYRRIEWKVIILIGSMLSLGAAMEATGTGRFIAAELVALVGGMPPVVILAGFFVLTVVLTQPMSNQAAAIVILPVALEMARQLGLNPRSFAMMIAVAASCSYMTPLEPASLMVLAPGKYRFADFLKVGTPLTFLIFAIAVVLVPIVWPLDAAP